MIYPEHHPVAPPSSLGRLVLCRGSGQAEAMSPPAPERPGAARGLFIHSEVLGKETLESLKPWDRVAIRKYREMVQDIITGYRNDTGAGEVKEEHREVTLLIHDSTGEPMTFGRADEIYRFPVCAVLIDLKTHPTGYLPETMTTAQLAAYAVGALQRWPGLQEVFCAAVAPYGPAEYYFRMRRSELPQWEAYIKDLVRWAERGGPRTAGIEQCQYCRALATCPEAVKIREEALALVRSPDGAPLIELEDGRYQIRHDGKLLELWEKVSLGLRQLEEVKARIKQALGPGGAVSEYLELRERGGVAYFRKVPVRLEDLPPVVQELLTQEDLEALLELRVSALEEACEEAAKARGMTKAEASRRVREALEPLLARGEPSFSVQKRKGRPQPAAAIE